MHSGTAPRCGRNRSVKALADHVSEAIGIEPNYRRLEADGWEQAPGVRRLDGTGRKE